MEGGSSAPDGLLYWMKHNRLKNRVVILTAGIVTCMPPPDMNALFSISVIFTPGFSSICNIKLKMKHRGDEKKGAVQSIQE